MEEFIACILIGITMALILILCFIVGFALIYLGEELHYSVRKIKRFIKETYWDLEWKRNHK